MKEVKLGHKTSTSKPSLSIENPLVKPGTWPFRATMGDDDSNTYFVFKSQNFKGEKGNKSVINNFL